MPTKQTLESTAATDDQDAAAPPSGLWGQLVALSPEGQQHIQLQTTEALLGRHEDCTYAFSDLRVSGYHCRIMRRPVSGDSQVLPGTQPLMQVYIEDLSTNGTFVNGQKIGRGNITQLNHQDEVSLLTKGMRGAKVFVFHDFFASTRDSAIPKCEAIAHQYHVKEELGKGNFGIVYRAIDKTTGLAVAIKVVDKRRMLTYTTRPDALKDEVAILKRLTHPGVVRMLDALETPDHLFMVLELIQGGELFDRIIKKRKYTEAEARTLMARLLPSVQYMHSVGIIHRDLKPENILLRSTDDDTDILISDFGVSRIIGPEGVARTLCGTPHYLAPEVIKRRSGEGYGKECDIWSLGVVLYILISGIPPFYEERSEPILDQVVNGRMEFPASHFACISKGAQHLIQRMMDMVPGTRITIAEALEHPWMQGQALTPAFLTAEASHLAQIRRRMQSGLPPRPENGGTAASAAKASKGSSAAQAQGGPTASRAV